MPSPLPRCQVVPVPDHQAAFLVDGVERTRWHFGTNYPRPFFYPLVGPGGVGLTRMGHPGATNHDHHESVWFAHNKVLGIDFWANTSPATIRQKQWLVYDDGDDEAAMAVELHWYDGHDPRELLRQTLVAVLRPGENEETFLELHSSFVPVADAIEFHQTNFGFLAVRMAKSISAHFGGGHLTGSGGQTGEPELFAKPARWMDYSGPVQNDPGGEPRWAGITYFDHPQNPNQPTHWHVRDDGWMGASVCLNGPVTTTQKKPLELRYLLHLHGGPVDASRASKIADDFAAGPSYRVAKSTQKHRQFQIDKTPAK